MIRSFFRFQSARRLVGIALLASIALLSGCANVGGAPAPEMSASPVLDRVLESGTLRVGMAGDTPPMNATNRSGALIGLEVDLAANLAEGMGVRAVFVKLPFGDLLGALESGRVDIVLSNMTMTPERNTKVAFAGPYLVSGKALLTKSEKLADADEPGDLDRHGLRISALRGSTSEQLLRRSADDAVVRLTETPAQAVQLVLRGEVDAMLGDYTIVALAVLRNPNAGLVGVSAPLTFEPIGAALPAGDALFENLVRNYLTLLEGTGTMDLLRGKWFLDSSWLAQLSDEH